MSEELKNYLGNINYEIETSDIELEKLDLGLNAKSWKELLDYINDLEKRNKEIYDGFMATTKELCEYATKEEQLKEYILTHKIYDEVKFKSELLKIIGGDDNE